MRVRIREHRQVVTEAGHHYGGELLDVTDATGAQWVRQGWADPLDTAPPQREGPSAPVGRANIQARIREELAADPTRSDRAIAAVVGCDHKTVAKARKTDPAPEPG